MKKLSLSLMLNVSLALMLALSLIYPQSVAVNFVAAWAILATVICVVAGGVGVYATEYVLERYVPVVMVKASTRITLDTPEVVCTNRLITGTLEVQKGGTMRGNIEHTGGELSSNGKVLHTHKHPGDSGGTTGSPL